MLWEEWGCTSAGKVAVAVLAEGQKRTHKVAEGIRVWDWGGIEISWDFNDYLHGGDKLDSAFGLMFCTFVQCIYNEPAPRRVVF